MKKFTSFLALIGAIALLWTAAKVVHYGSVNMNRANESYIHWRTTGELR